MDKAFYLLFFAVTVIALFTFRDYGYSWDEIWQNRREGMAVVRFYASLGKDLSATDTDDLYLYGGLYDGLSELFVYFSPFEPRNSRHLINVMAALFGVWGTWKTARLVGGSAAGFWAALFLITTAPFYGHMFINAKDIPFATAYIWSLYLLMRTVPHFPTPPLRSRIWLGVALGLTLGTRIGGTLIILYYLLVGGVDVGVQYFRVDHGERISQYAARFTLACIPVLILAYFIMIIGWPAALLNPISIPIEALLAASKFNWPDYVLWNGKFVLASDLPWNYLPVLFGVELPEHLLILLIVAIPWSFWRMVRNFRSGKYVESLWLGLLIVASLFPPCWAIANKAILYDNMRHFIFILPPLACIAGLGCTVLTQKIGVLFKPAKWLFLGGIVCSLLYQVKLMSALHPYEYVYLNNFAGGMPAGAKKFDTEYWLTSYFESAVPLRKHVQMVANALGEPLSDSKFSVSIAEFPMNMDEYLPKHFVVRPLNENIKTDYLIATTRWNNDQVWPDYPVIATVSRLGMPFAVIKASPELAEMVGPLQ